MRAVATLLAGLVAGACAVPESAPRDLARSAMPPWPADAPSARKGLYAGSWRPDGPQGFDQEWIEEARLREVYTMQSAGRRTWRGLQSSESVVPLDALVRDRTGPAVAYSFHVVTRGDAVGPQPAVLHLRHRGRIRVRLDGKIALDEPAPASSTWGHVAVPVTLDGPYPVLLVKCGRGSTELGDSMNFELRLSSPDGRPLDGQGWNTISRPPPGAPREGLQAPTSCSSPRCHMSRRLRPVSLAE